MCIPCIRGSHWVDKKYEFMNEKGNTMKKSNLTFRVIVRILLAATTTSLGFRIDAAAADSSSSKSGDLMASQPMIVAELSMARSSDYFARFAMNWMKESCGDPDWCEDCDLDRNGFVNFEDLQLFCYGWLRDPGYLCIRWLMKQQNLSTGLVESYADNGDSNAWTYDQALAIIAFTETGELQRAQMVLDRMRKLQAANLNRAWYECYLSNDPDTICSQSYITGPIAFVVIAVNYYEYITNDPNYAPMARDALSWLTKLRNVNPADERYGSIGYSSQLPNVISTEHNADAYSAFLWRGKLDHNQSYIEIAESILDYLRIEMWAPSSSSNGPYHNVNVFWRGFNDFDFCTDPQTWTVLSLGSIGPSGEEFYKALDWLWYNPYGSTRVTNLQDFNIYICNVDGFKSCTWESDYIWIEGTEGAATAYYSIGQNDKGDFLHKQMARTFSSNKGLVHSFCESQPTMISFPKNYRFEHIASVAWYFFNEVGINPFHPDSITK